MNIALGIDTGGTYTDATLVDHATGAVLAGAKALTTRQNLAIGIQEAIRAVLAAPTALPDPISASDIVLVGLSTTLATNAMVEGQGGAVCLLLIGYDPLLMQQYGFERELGTADFVYIAGGHDAQGNEAAPLDEGAVAAAATAYRGRVEAFAVSGYFSVQNPDHELRARAIIEQLTGLPTTCGHELSTKLNAVRRATTAALNARLIAPLAELMARVRQSLDELDIAAPLMVVKGDGSLVQAQWAMRRPIETILSGPAASVVGGWHLAGRRDAWVVDVGGTTTDIAALRNGLPLLNQSGARVGGWRTMVQAIDVHTTGLGGDSHVRPGKDGLLAIGPRRAVPLSLLAARHPEVLSGLRRQVADAAEYPAADLGEYILSWRQPATRLSEADAELLQRLAAGPRSRLALIDAVSAGAARRAGPIRSRIDSLIERGLLQRAAFTPTDALHVLGRLALWDAEAARLGAGLLARVTGLSVPELCEQVVAGVAQRAATALVSKILEDRTGQPCDWQAQPLAQALLADGLRDGTAPADDHAELQCWFSVTRPIVAIGAPVPAYMPAVARALHTELVIPAHADVANAVGAVVGTVVQRVPVRLEPADEQVRVFLPGGWHDCPTLAAAAEYAEHMVRPYAEDLARQAGAEHVEVTVTREDHWARTTALLSDGTPQQVYLGSDLTFVAAGRPAAVRRAKLD